MNEEMKRPSEAEETTAEVKETSETEVQPEVEVQPVEAVVQPEAAQPVEEAVQPETEARPLEAAAPAAEEIKPTRASQTQPTDARPTNASPYSQSKAYTDSVTWQGQTQAPTPAPTQKKKKGKAGRAIAKIASVAALAVLFGAVSGAIFIGIANANLPSGGDTVQTDGGNTTTTNPVQNASDRELVSVADAMKEALERAALAETNKLTVAQINIIMEPAMVSITAVGETYVQSFFGTSVYPTQSSGSGIIVGENDTEILVATNNHVVADSNEITVQFADASEVAALIKGTDAKNDLAVLAVKKEDIAADTAAVIAIAELGDSDALVIGEGVVAVGNALGFGQSVTDGIVSALNRAVEDSDGNVSYMIQTNAAINPGNSGGALVNMQGQVIGINSAKYADEAVEGMGFAIPINTALPILEELMARTTRTEVTDSEKAAYLGITPQDVTTAMRDSYGWPVGVYVYNVEKGSAAEKAGLVKGDIITAFDGETITSSSDLRKTLSYYEAGETVEITVERYERGSFETVTIELTLDKKPAEEAEPQSNEAGNFWDRFGN